jgi:peroxiredoxin
MKIARFLTTLALVWAAPALAVAPAPTIDIGPQVGTRIPALHAIDASGNPATLASISGKHGVVLLFFRSAKWCPYCEAQLIEFKAAQAPLEARGYRLAALSYDATDVQAAFVAKHQIAYQLLSDRKSVTIDAWGLRDPQYRLIPIANGVPKPAIFVISPTGVIQAKLAKEGYKVRPSVAEVLAAVDSISR